MATDALHDGDGGEADPVGGGGGGGGDACGTGESTPISSMTSDCVSFVE